MKSCASPGFSVGLIPTCSPVSNPLPSAGCCLTPLTTIIASGSVPLQKDPPRLLAAGLVGALVLPLLLLVRQWLGWTFVLRRLLAESIEYEESGWYDGQIWEKTTGVAPEGLVGGAASGAPPPVGVAAVDDHGHCGRCCWARCYVASFKAAIRFLSPPMSQPPSPFTVARRGTPPSPLEVFAMPQRDCGIGASGPCRRNGSAGTVAHGRRGSLPGQLRPLSPQAPPGQPLDSHRRSGAEPPPGEATGHCLCLPSW